MCNLVTGFRCRRTHPVSIIEHFEVPLVSATNARCLATEIAVSAPSDVYLAAAGDGWETVALNAQRNSKAEDARWLLRRASAAASIEFKWTNSSWLLQPATNVERAWLEAMMNTQGTCRIRARYLVKNADPARLAVRIPDGSKLTSVEWDGESIPVQQGSEANTFELVGIGPSESPVMLEMDVVSVARKPLGTWGTQLWSPHHNS